jgi:hypothetical protein
MSHTISEDHLKGLITRADLDREVAHVNREIAQVNRSINNLTSWVTWAIGLLVVSIVTFGLFFTSLR